MSYVECPKCGQRALSVATQCPHCGLDFLTAPPKHPVAEEEVPRLRRQILVAALLLAVVLVIVGIALARHQAASSEGMSPPPAKRIDSTPAKPTRRNAPRTASRTDSAPPVTPVPRGDSARPTSPAPSAVLPSDGQQMQRYATDWVNVRSGRNPAAPRVLVLNRGQAVLVDSLKQGWYRVLMDGRPVGYVYRSFLGATPPPGRP